MLRKQIRIVNNLPLLTHIRENTDFSRQKPQHDGERLHDTDSLVVLHKEIKSW